MPDLHLQWGLLSTARINRDLIQSIKAAPGHEILAVASRSEERARAYAHHWGIRRSYGSYEELLADPDVEVIYISLPNSLHAEWTIAAAQSGKHVLCEKPLAMSAEEVDSVQRVAEQSDAVITEAFMYRHHPQTLKVKELVDSGAIGKLRVIYGAFSYNLKDKDDIRLDPRLGGGSIWDMGCYPISYARYLTGLEPIEVMGQQFVGPTGVDEIFAGQMRFPGDVYAQFTSGFRMASREELQITGDVGWIHLTNSIRPQEGDQILLSREDKAEEMSFPTQEVFLGEILEIGQVISRGDTPRVSLGDSRNNVAVIQALCQSAIERKPVTIPKLS